MQDYTKLAVWEKAHLLTLEIYKATVDFPKEEVYGLTAQTRRASTSIPANIAEGCGRDGKAELGRFLQIASGSTSALLYNLRLACDLGYMDAHEYARLNRLTAEVKRMLSSLSKKLKTEVTKL
jgi:four helix bundle protein